MKFWTDRQCGLFVCLDLLLDVDLENAGEVKEAMHFLLLGVGIFRYEWLINAWVVVRVLRVTDACAVTD